MGTINKYLLVGALFLFLFGAAYSIAPKGDGRDQVLCFVAASTAPAFRRVANEFEREHRVKVKLNFASSSTLVRQILNGAGADIFLSANPKWMEECVKGERISPEQSAEYLGNSLVLISRNPQKTFADFLHSGQVSMGEPESVPVGIYGKKALEDMNLWGQVEKRIVPARDALAALNNVTLAGVEYGLVYKTDAMLDKRAHILSVLPDEAQPKIVYCIALTRSGESNPVAEIFIDYLRSDKAGVIFREYGFRFLADREGYL